MLKGGATLTWEHWFPHDGTHSHPWASTPASAIANGLMGLKPVLPGWVDWSCKPAPGNLTSAAIILPTSKGTIGANFTRTAGPLIGSSSSWALTIAITVPMHTVASLCMPLFGADPSAVTLTLDGEAQAHSRLEDKGSYMCVDGVRALENSPNQARILSTVVVPGSPYSPPPVPPSPHSLLPPLRRVPNIDPLGISISGLRS